MLHSSYIEISKSALQANLDFIRRQVAPGVQVSSVIKGNAYGHGIEQFAPLAQDCGIGHFSVFSADEAQRLLQSLTAPATVLIMGYIGNAALEWAVAEGIEFYVFDLDRLAEAAQVSERLGKPAKIHLELETGMNRTGFAPADLNAVQKMLHKNRRHLVLQGLCTHFAGAESYQNHERVLTQLSRFQAQRQRLSQSGIIPKQLHTACSAAMMQYPDTHMDMVRIGIMQYGFWPSPETYSAFRSRHPESPDPLRRLINWKSSIMSLKHVPQGEYVGYGTSFQAPRDMVLAMVPVGYAWGYSRTLSNQGQVLLHGQKANVVGIVNMNGMMVDVTDIPAAQKGDEVVLLGKQGDHSISVASFAELSEQLNYELLTRLPLNIPRFIID
ncbi:alanine racemase [Pontibacter saemangeumensis]|uniref:Alanine racemase n=1 Tax=Pontibacter saemangeumensis TaxID=1084525 RepID=A0ABP8M611_9BACT